MNQLAQIKLAFITVAVEFQLINTLKRMSVSNVYKLLTLIIIDVVFISNNLP